MFSFNMAGDISKNYQVYLDHKSNKPTHRKDQMGWPKNALSIRIPKTAVRKFLNKDCQIFHLKTGPKRQPCKLGHSTKTIEKWAQKGFKDSNLPTNRSESFLTHTRTEIHFSKKGKKSNVKRKTFLCKNPLKFSNFENSATWRSVFPLVRHVWSDCRRTNGNVSFARKKKTGVSRDVTT